jgi:4-hydroxybenzoate polyprenyltransferase
VVRDYVSLARPDHWFKNVFMVPGIVLGWLACGQPNLVPLIPTIALSFVSACLVASSNYTINEWLDAAEDATHPDKKTRPAAAGRIKGPFAYLQWFLLAVAGLAVGWAVSPRFFWSAAALFVMGIIYNVEPLRTKERPYIDTLSESVNNPLRLLLGWYTIDCALVPPASLLLAYWMLGAFFMAIKRFAELRHINNDAVAASYRKSFRYYTPEKLLISVVFYATAFGLFGGVFLIRYHVELILAVPFLAGLMAMYMYLGLLPNSPAQNPEALFGNRPFLVYSCVTAVVLVVTSIIRLPWLAELFQSTVPSGF